MLTTDRTPPPKEIQKQLAHMLAQRRFKNAPRQAKFLSVVVSRALLDADCSEKAIGPEIFPNFIPDESDDVRVNAKNLRQNLQEYFDDEGKYDLVSIRLPKPATPATTKGQPYRPVFEYNPEHEVSKELSLIDFYLDRNTLGDGYKAANHLELVNASMPEHLGVKMAAAKAIIKTTKPDQSEEEKDMRLRGVLSILVDIEGVANEWWKLHAMFGWVFMKANDNEEAKAAFKKALQLDRAETRRFLPYHEFLARIGEGERALDLARQHLARNVNQKAAHLHFLTISYRTSRTEGLDEVLANSIEIDRFEPTNYAILGWYMEEHGHIEEANFFYRTSKNLIEHLQNPSMYPLEPFVADLIGNAEFDWVTVMRDSRVAVNQNEKSDPSKPPLVQVAASLLRSHSRIVG